MCAKMAVKMLEFIFLISCFSILSMEASHSFSPKGNSHISNTTPSSHGHIDDKSHCTGSCKKIHINIVVDTDSLYSEFSKSKNKPSHDSYKPTAISADKYVFMVASGRHVASGQGTSGLHIEASIGDTISWTSTSESGSLVGNVILYKWEKKLGEKILSEPHFPTIEKLTVQPGEGKPFPVTSAKRKFWYMESDVLNKGSLSFKIYFAMYHRDPKSEHQELFGFFEFDSKLTVVDSKKL